MAREKEGLKVRFFDKLELLALLFFVFGIFLLDVNINMVASYGQNVNVHVFLGKTVSSMSMFWLGFIHFFKVQGQVHI